MKRYYILLWSLLCCCYCKAQSHVDEQISQKINELKKDGVDTIVSYHRYCVGYQRLISASDTSCRGFDVHYLLWTKSNLHYLKKFDECRQYSTEEIAKDFLITFSSNFKIIGQEYVKPPTFDKIIKGKKQELVTYIDHSCHSAFKFFMLNTSFEKTIDDFDLETQYVDGKYLNKYYKHNHQTKLYKLKTLIEAELKRLSL